MPEILFLGLLSGILIVVLAVLYLRYRGQQMLHEERMAALEKEAAVPTVWGRDPWTPHVYLLRGLIWSFSGAALLICLFGLAVSSRRPESAESMAYRAQALSRNLGVALDQARQMVDKDEPDRTQGMPLGVALLGLIPLGVGLAYLMFYRSDESRNLPGAGL
jgi:hypothetical protein